jgi:(p)ppGpp synthase/HD superfamily hydrolase
MDASVAAAAARRGLRSTEVARLSAALLVAMKPRESRIEDDHDPAFLHPGRVALILLNDTETTDPSTLAVAVLLESRDPELRAAEAELRAALGPDIAEAVGSIPSPGDTDLAERLVTMDPALVTAALAERLDHLRHEHLRAPVVPWDALWSEVSEVWLPVAERTSEPLARRYRHWLRTFGRKL